VPARHALDGARRRHLQPVRAGRARGHPRETGAYGEETDGLGDAIDGDGDGDMDKVVMDPSGGRSLILVDTDGDRDADRTCYRYTELDDV
jgi:hypothetical protein